VPKAQVCVNLVHNAPVELPPARSFPARSFPARSFPARASPPLLAEKAEKQNSAIFSYFPKRTGEEPPVVVL